MPYYKSEIGRLARTLWSAKFNGLGIFVMLSPYTAYFDASLGAKDELNGTWVCGFISSVSAWESFEIDWTLALARHEVPYFHMKAFVASQKPFDAPKWKAENYRASFVATLASIIKSCAIRSIGCGLWHENFDFVNKSYDLDARFNPYAICGRDCAVRAKKFIRDKYSADAPIEFVFARGDRGHGLLTEEMMRSGLPAPIYKPSQQTKGVDDKPAIQLQACDFAAWEMRREANRRSGLEKSKRMRKSFEVLATIPHSWMHYLHKDLVALCKTAGINERGKVICLESDGKGAKAKRRNA